MNPQTDFEDGDTETTRAFFELFVRVGDMFKFPVDSGVDNSEEIRVTLNTDDSKFDGATTVNIFSVNQRETFDEIISEATDIGLNVVHEKTEDFESELLGRYTSHSAVLMIQGSIDAEWNVPHCVIYGSLSPEVEEACHEAFGNQYEYLNVRNHFIVRGAGFDERDKDRLSDEIQSSDAFFESERKDYRSWVRTSAIV